MLCIYHGVGLACTHQGFTFRGTSVQEEKKQGRNQAYVWGHKYQMAITHKIYSLRGSFPKLTNSLSHKMYACLIKNEKNYTRQTA